MKRLLTMVPLVLIASTLTAGAQENPTRRLTAAVGRTVFVIDGERREWQGRLLKVSADALEVESDAGIRTFKVENIRRVDADSDGVGDGALKGALFGLGMVGLGALTAGAEGVPFLVSGVTVYSLLGLAIDAGCSSRHPVYNGPAVPRLDKPATSGPAMLQVSMKVRW
jgi:hypothetical protein